jgi:hypothetical protein
MLQTTRQEAEDIRWDITWNVIVLAVCAALLLPLGRWALLARMIGALGVLLLALIAGTGILGRVLRALRVEDDPPSDAFLLANTAFGVLLLAAWAGYVALLVRESTAGAPVWVAALACAAGFLASHAAFTTVSMVYRGSFYRVANVVTALGGYLLFSAWPAAARAVFGWLG